MKSNLFARLSALTVVLLFAACAAPVVDRNGVIVSKDEYESVTPLGSHIPVLVKKGQTPVTASPGATIGGEEAADAIHRAGGQMSTLPAGQKP